MAKDKRERYTQLNGGEEQAEIRKPSYVNSEKK